MPLRLPLLLLTLCLWASPVQAGEPDGPPPTGVLTRAPELLQFVTATHPESEAGRGASVVLQLTLGEDGRVEDATVVESAGEAFDAAALEAVRNFVFSPAEVDGVPARVRILYRYDFVLIAAQPSTAEFAGTVRDRETKQPLPGVTVTLGDGRWVVTDAEGRFEWTDLPAGPTLVTLEGPRLTPLSTEEEFFAGERLEALYEVFLSDPDEEQGDDLEILVSAPAIKRQVVSTEIAAEDARKVPGTQGDVLRVVENLPGVARATLGTGSLLVWGAAPSDTGVYVDGVPVPRLYHDGGLRSVVGSELVQSVALLPGGYGAAYGRGLGGLVLVNTKPMATELGGSVSADLYDSSASVSGPLGQRWSYAVGGRVSHVGALLGAFSPEVEDYFPLPHYKDAQARLGLRLGPQEQLVLTALASSDQTARVAPNPDPARVASEDKRLAFQRLSLRYVRDSGEGEQVSAMLWAGADQAEDLSTFGAVSTSNEIMRSSAGARLSYRARLAPIFTLEAGMDAQLSQAHVTRTGSIAVPSREGDLRVFGQPPPDQISSDVFSVTTLNAAPYLETDLGLLSDRLHLILGARGDPYARSVSRAAPQEGLSPTHGLYQHDPKVEPRLLLRYAPNETLALSAAWGRYAQQPQVSDLSASFGTPALPVSTATHRVLTGSWTPGPAFTLELVGFFTSSEALSMRNRAAQPARAEALSPTGRGRSYGVQTMTRLDTEAGLYGWVSYTLSWSERQDAPELAWRASDYDQRHVLTALCGYTLPWELELGLRLRVATGFPRSEVLGAYYDSRRDLYQPVFGVQNAERLPVFFQVDARLSKTLALGATELDLSLEIQNLSNHNNVEEYIYNADYSERGTIRGLPILPVLGLRWSF